MTKLGIIIIGRNEGERLRRCLTSVSEAAHREAVVYVDSGSTDQSVELAESFGVDVVPLDMSTPFSAGRARNEGFRHLTRKYPQLKFIQFIDGDCELCEGWIDIACKHLKQHSSCAVVAGRTKERFPEKSIYNLLCDIEWITPSGEVKSCGGIFMTQKSAFQEANGFNQTVVSGEEPELCYRLRKRGWKVYRLDHLMVLHDSAMTRFSQWWKRSVRSGQGFAQGYMLHNTGSEYCMQDSLRIWFWALIVPALILLLSLLLSPWWLLLFGVYPAHAIKIATNINRRLENWKYSFCYAIFTVIGKWPQLYGQLIFMVEKISRKPLTIIEHK